MSGIADVHDLHVWNISTGLPVLTAHVHIGEDAEPSAVLCQLEAYVRSLGINHSTIQVRWSEEHCTCFIRMHSCATVLTVTSYKHVSSSMCKNSIVRACLCL